MIRFLKLAAVAVAASVLFSSLALAAPKGSSSSSGKGSSSAAGKGFNPKVSNPQVTKLVLTQVVNSKITQLVPTQVTNLVPAQVVNPQVLQVVNPKVTKLVPTQVINPQVTNLVPAQVINPQLAQVINPKVTKLVPTQVINPQLAQVINPKLTKLVPTQVVNQHCTFVTHHVCFPIVCSPIVCCPIVCGPILCNPGFLGMFGVETPVQYERYLRLHNNTGEKVTFFIRHHTQDLTGDWDWFPEPPSPGATKWLTFVLEPGQVLDPLVLNRRLAANRIRLQAVSASRIWGDYRDVDLWLVPEMTPEGVHLYRDYSRQTYDFHLTAK